MGEQRQRFNEEFKKQAVKYVQEQTKSIGEICVELGVSKSALHQWIGRYRKFENEQLVAPDKVRQLEQRLKEQEEISRQRECENADLQEELAILKKALHIFSKEQN